MSFRIEFTHFYTSDKYIRKEGLIPSQLTQLTQLKKYKTIKRKILISNKVIGGTTPASTSGLIGFTNPLHHLSLLSLSYFLLYHVF